MQPLEYIICGNSQVYFILNSNVNVYCCMWGTWLKPADVDSPRARVIEQVSWMRRRVAFHIYKTNQNIFLRNHFSIKYGMIRDGLPFTTLIFNNYWVSYNFSPGVLLFVVEVDGLHRSLGCRVGLYNAYDFLPNYSSHIYIKPLLYIIWPNKGGNDHGIQ